MDLATYTSNVQGLLNDPLSQFYTSANLNNWINRARTEVAKRSSCIRVLIPSSGSVISLTLTAPGSGYTSATATISGPDAISGVYTTATASLTLSAGQVSTIMVVNPGSGYVLTPTVTISGNGSGATAKATLSPHLTTTVGQEVVTFATASVIAVQTNPGVQAVLGVQDVAVSWGGMKPNLDYLPWSTFQALLRSYNQGQNYPQVWSQYSQGESGSIYLYPIPAGNYEMQWDCYCTPLALTGTQALDLIPDNWTTAVFYYAAHLAYLNAQRRDDANDMFSRYERALTEANAYATPARTPSYYPSDF